MVGESSADRLAKVVTERLQRSGERSVELLHCALPGSNMTSIERRFHEVVGYRPDEIVVLMGHNLFFPDAPNEAALRLQLWRSRSRLFSLIAHATQPAWPIAIDQTKIFGDFEQVLQRMAAEAKRTGITVVLATMPSNLRFRPLATVEEENRTEYLNALLLEDLARHEEAAMALRELDPDGTHALWQFELGELEYRGGHYAAAKTLFERARDLDSFRNRAPGEVNARIRAVASERPAVTLRDTIAAVDAVAPHSIPGWESFLDNCHLRRAPLEIEAAAILPASIRNVDEPPGDAHLREEEESLRPFGIMLQQGNTGNEALARMWAENVELSLAQALSAGTVDRAALTQIEESREFQALSPAKRAEVWSAIAGAWARVGRRDDAAAADDRAVNEADSATAWFKRARHLLQGGQRAAALEAAEKAAAIDPHRPDVLFYLERLKGGTTSPSPSR